MSSPLTPRPGIMEIAPYVGGEAHVEGAKRIIRLASNENPDGASEKAIEVYKAAAGDLHRYPDGGSTELRHALADLHGLKADNIVCGAGSDELIALLIKAYAGPGDEVLYSAHGFLMYSLAALGAGAKPVAAPEKNLTADIEALASLANEKTKLCFIANPNNPTGSMLSRDQLYELRKALPDHTLLVIDAAYAEYVESEDYSDGVDLVEAFENVVMTRTFSKIYGLAALRLGWAYCPPEVAGVLNRLRGPFNVTATAQVVGVAAVKDQDYIVRSREVNREVRDWFAGELKRLNIAVRPSEGNFLLAEFGNAKEVQDQLRQEGILVRQMGGYGLPGFLRISIGTREEMEAVVEALESKLK